MEPISIRSKWRLFAWRIDATYDDNEIHFFKRSFPWFGAMKEFASFPLKNVIFWGGQQ